MDNQTLVSRGTQPVDSTSRQVDNPFAGQGVFYDEKPAPFSEQGRNSDNLATPWDALAPGPITGKDMDLGAAGLPMPRQFDDFTKDTFDGLAVDEDTSAPRVLSGAEADQIAEDSNTLPPGASAAKTTKEAVNWAYKTGCSDYDKNRGDPYMLWDKMTEDKRKYQRGAGVTADTEGVA